MNEIIKKNGVTYGVIAGIVSILITTIVYAVDLSLMTKWWFGLVVFAISIGISITLLTKTKNELKGHFTFKEAFTTYFICSVIGTLISVLFTIVLFNFIDPGAKEILKELILEFTKNIMQKVGAPASEMNKALKEIAAKDSYSIIEQLKGSVFSIAFSAILGLILAAIFKSKTPEYS
jgi:Protein of unknown function (DUF4199)